LRGAEERSGLSRYGSNNKKADQRDHEIDGAFHWCGAMLELQYNPKIPTADNPSIRLRHNDTYSANSRTLQSTMKSIFTTDDWSRVFDLNNHHPIQLWKTMPA
jgi:hypothetical protein